MRAFLLAGASATSALMAHASGVPTPQLTLQDFRLETLRGAAGHVRVGLTRAGQWWLVDARDQPFFSRGVNGLNRTGTTGSRTAQLGSYAATVEAIYGTAEPKIFADAALVRLPKWGFNTLGAWAGAEFWDRGVAYTEMMDFRQAAPETTIRLGGAKVPDVFDPRWVEACDHRAAERALARVFSRELIGYFTDDDLVWAQPDGEAGTGEDEGAKRAARPSLLQICLSLEPSFPAYHAAWEFTLAAHGGEWATMARAWDVTLPNKEALRQLTLNDVALVSAGYGRDQERFSREFARRYFAVTAAAIRRHDPHHLILGCRFSANPGAAVLAECVAPQVDVVSLSCRDEKVWSRIEVANRAQGMPILLGEFSWTGETFKRSTAPGETPGLSPIERMLSRGRATLERACAHPALVGYAWARWADRDEQRPPLGEGLVRCDDHEAHEHTDALTDFNARVVALRLAAAAAK